MEELDQDETKRTGVVHGSSEMSGYVKCSSVP